jgi:hypothetical protein
MWLIPSASYNQQFSTGPFVCTAVNNTDIGHTVTLKDTGVDPSARLAGPRINEPRRAVSEHLARRQTTADSAAHREPPDLSEFKDRQRNQRDIAQALTASHLSKVSVLLHSIPLHSILQPCPLLVAPRENWRDRFARIGPPQL